MSEAPLTTVSRKLAHETSRRIAAEVRADAAEGRAERLRAAIREARDHLLVASMSGGEPYQILSAALSADDAARGGR